MPPALQFLVLTFAGWVNRHQDDLIAYLREENRVLREHLGPRPLRRTDAQRRRLAVRGQKLGRRVLMQVAGIVTPDTILRWYRRLIAQTYDGSARRGRGRPMTRRARRIARTTAVRTRFCVNDSPWVSQTTRWPRRCRAWRRAASRRPVSGTCRGRPPLVAVTWPFHSDRATDSRWRVTSTSRHSSAMISPHRKPASAPRSTMRYVASPSAWPADTSRS